MMRKGSAGSNTTADHIEVADASIAALPPAFRRRLMVTCDGAGASHGLIGHLDKLAARPGYQVIYSVGWDLGKREKAAITQVPDQAWQIAVDPRGEVRERRADEACADRCCAHARCWIEEAHVTELTGLVRGGPAGDQLAGWPAGMRVFARRERPHPGAQLTLFEAADGWRYTLWVTNLPAALRGWRANPAYIDAAHRVHARVEDRMIPRGSAWAPTESLPRLRSSEADGETLSCATGVVQGCCRACHRWRVVALSWAMSSRLAARAAARSWSRSSSCRRSSMACCWRLVIFCWRASMWAGAPSPDSRHACSPSASDRRRSSCRVRASSRVARSWAASRSACREVRVTAGPVPLLMRGVASRAWTWVSRSWWR